MTRPRPPRTSGNVQTTRTTRTTRSPGPDCTDCMDECLQMVIDLKKRMIHNNRHTRNEIFELRKEVKQSIRWPTIVAIVQTISMLGAIYEAFWHIHGV